MIARVLPYLPSPRPPAPELGRHPAGSPHSRAIGLAQHLAGIALFAAAPALFAWAAIYCLLADDWSIYVARSRVHRADAGRARLPQVASSPPIARPAGRHLRQAQ